MLGWAPKPKVFIPDEYGEDEYVKINENGFRDDDDTNKIAEDHKIRIFCSGDSFTFGQGVANNETWCHYLGLLNDNFDSVNLAQNGYGVDQMYLRYKRDAISLEHSIHIFAFISGDLDRMSVDTKYGYGKPIMKVDADSGELITDNIPVPKLRWDLHRLINRLNFRSIDFLQRILSKVFKKSDPLDIDYEKVGLIAEKVMLEIHRNSAANNVIPVFVYLPTKNDLWKDYPWRLWSEKTMEKHGLNFIDITVSMRERSVSEGYRFFIPPHKPGGGHYSESGNAWIAETIYKEIEKMPGIKKLIDEKN